MAVLAVRSLFFLTWCTLVQCNCPNNTVKINDGACMPLINLGGVQSMPSNYSLWLDLGGRGLDTAWAYGDDVQKAVGDAVTASGIRTNLFITTKVPCCPDLHTLSGYACSSWAGMKPDEVVKKAAATSLELLGVSYVDLLLLHEPCDTMKETVAAYLALEEMKASGKARAIGISNFNKTLIDALMKEVKVLPAVNQCGFSIGGVNNSATGSDFETLKHCQDLGIMYSAFSPLGGQTGIDILHDPDVVAIAATHKKSTAEIALRWVVQQGVVAVTASNKESHDLSDLDIFNFELTNDEMMRLKAKGEIFNVLEPEQYT
eukprot:gnl/MRDRNA2_/MRDRNA2_115292_c0_seq1.p1 gnl/MRDRNA2_/MRDRNA2_115292_c0~~gnl/MRDRNA2_/MRDRNA2_115292_c0_seq1.p1  ORF type:complete len:317 (+),score=63.75 gnl/MRDRNA2_/MRDRNA2_115292_c0_seq1:79-1029(+)